MTIKWNIVKDQSKAIYDVGNEIIYYKKFLKPNLCDCSDAYTSVRGDTFTTAHNNATPVAFKNRTPLIRCIAKIDGTTTDDAEDLDLVMPMYILIEYS